MTCAFCSSEDRVHVRRVPPFFKKQEPICPKCYAEKAGPNLDPPTQVSKCGAAGTSASFTLEEIERYWK